jgi:hypothetical protein
MALHDPTTDRDDVLASKTRKCACAINQNLKAGAPQSTQLLIEELDTYLGDSQALAEIIKQTALGKNAFQELINKLVWAEAERQAEAELVAIERHRKEEVEERRVEWWRDFREAIGI